MLDHLTKVYNSLAQNWLCFLFFYCELLEAVLLSKNFNMESCIEEVSLLLRNWEEEDAQGRDVTPILKKLAEIFELETENFLKQDPDPFDDRHPSRSQPDCTLGHILKTVFRNERIVDEMVKVYCQRDVIELNTAVCRLLLDILPGLENVIFQEEGFVSRLFQWSESAPNPLQSYATGLLAAAMDVPEIASSYRERNSYFVPLMLKRLKERSIYYLVPKIIQTDCEVEVFSSSSVDMYYESLKEDNLDSPAYQANEDPNNSHRKSRKKRDSTKCRYNPMYSEQKVKERKSVLKIPPVDKSTVNESSNSNWTESIIGPYHVFPLTLAAQQRYILQYLTPLGEYQELIGNVFEENALVLILQYIDSSQNPDIRLAFEALKYLASLLCHKKIAIEFLNIGGLKLLLKVPRPSIAATGVSFCFYYLGYLEEAIEKICMFPPDILSDLVSYALWLLECSHDSSRCHATLFFGFGFAFKCILQHFDQQDGLRKLFNVMSTLDIFASTNARTLSDDEIFAKRLTTRHVCGSLKRYFEAHLAALLEEKRSASSRTDGTSNVVFSKAASLTSEVVYRNMEILHESSQVPLSHWIPVNEFVNLDGVTFLLELISTYFELSYSGRAETVKNALDVLKICALATSAQLKFCEKISSPDFVHYTGISVLLQAAEGDMMPVAEVQRSALVTLINCVCSKLSVVDSCPRNTPTPKKKTVRHTEDLLSRLWKAVRIKNGIIVLINLLSIKTPVTDADSIRALACKVLCGLARSQNVKQILMKLPLVTDGQLIDLMKEPVLQDKCQYHVQFCKYGLELIERVTGAPLSVGSECSMNLNKICVSEVVAKTTVIYQDYQLLQLICDHLTQKGFTNTVESLQHEMDEKLVVPRTQVSLDAFPSLLNDSVHQNSPTVSSPKTVHSVEKSNKFFGISSPVSHSNSTTLSSIPPPSVPLKIILNKKSQSPDIRSPPCRLQKPQMCSGNYAQSPAFSKMKRKTPGTSFKASEPSISLDSIVTDYLRKQHALCKNPMLACPPFDLFALHKCPEPHFRRNAPTNCVLRLQKREIAFKNGGYRGAALNTKHIYSRFRLQRTIRDEDGRCDFTTSAFFSKTNEPGSKLLVGTVNGRVKVINAFTGKQMTSKDCHFRGITYMETRESVPLFITSDGGRIGSTIWELSSTIDLINNFNVSHMEFGKRGVEKLIGTRHDSAVIFDTGSFSEVQAFQVDDLGNNYGKNRATFDFRDELVLSDGLIYDVRSGKMIHKLDKFNSTINGVFHPNGREIICNSEIWDMRSFKLLRTVAGLDQCRVTFNKPGTVIYAVSYNKDLKTAGKMSCFYTFDAWDYNTIATIDVKRPVYHVATDLNERFISTIESLNGLESICRLYEPGRTKQVGDENGDESEDSDEESDGDNEEVDEDNEDSSYPGQGSEVQFEDDEDNEEEEEVEEEEDDNDDEDEEGEINLITTSDSDDDDEETLFSINTSFEV